MNKRDGNKEETEKALTLYNKMWNLWNPDDKKNKEYWEQEQTKAQKEGYKTEICDCGSAFLGFQHFVKCDEENCPMKGSGGSILEQMLGIGEK